MYERVTSTNLVIAASLWSATAALLIISGVIMFVGHWKVALLLAEVACCLSAFAAVRHIRCYASRICQRIDDLAIARDVARLTGLPRQRVDH